MSEKQWSPYQQAIFEEIENDEGGHLVVEALAGSGKTSTIVEALSHTYDGDRVLMVAFNKSIAEELKTRVPPGVEVSTLHSFGLKAITRAHGRRKINGYTVADELRKRDRYMGREARNAIVKLVGLAKGCLLESVEDLDSLADAYGIDVPRGYDRFKLISTAARLVSRARESTDGPIDFDDMIFLPVAQDLALPTFDFVFVDETQDLNRAQLEIVVRAAGDKGRIVAVGDRRQAIYGFRGADSQAIPRMIDRLGAKVLPLSITYRCPQKVVREAQRLVPTIEEAPTASEGIVRSASEDELFAKAAPGDFVISRTNAPLISLAWRWLASGRKAIIRGRDIASGLSAFVRQADAYKTSELVALVEKWRADESGRLAARGRPADHVDDKADCLIAICEGCETCEEVLEKLERLFGDRNEAGAILLSSTHRSKGLEADRVWLLRDTYRAAEGGEEANLLYVAITRAKRELIYVKEEASSEAASTAAEAAE